MISNTEKNWATLTHIGAFGQYLFPLGNFIIPIIIWSSKKNESEFIDNNGKQCINFQLSVFLYSLILGAIFVPAFFITFLSHITFNELIHDRHFIIQDLNFSENVGLIINSSRGIIYASNGTDFEEKAREEALKLQMEMETILVSSSKLKVYFKLK